MTHLPARPDQRLVPVQVPPDVVATVQDALREGSTVVLDDAYPGGLHGVDYSALVVALGLAAEPLVLSVDEMWEIPVPRGRLLLLQDYVTATGVQEAGDVVVDWNPAGWRIEMRRSACSQCGSGERLVPCRMRGN